jgi:hypothetical protein
LDKVGWISVLHLSDMWQMQLLRKDALDYLNPIASDVEKLVLAETYDIPQWVLPALVALVNRDQALNVEESEKIGWARAIKVAGLREQRLRVVPPYRRADGDGRVVTHTCNCGHDTRASRQEAQRCRRCNAEGTVVLWTASHGCSCKSLACGRCGRYGTNVASKNILTPDQVGNEFGIAVQSSSEEDSA